MNFTLELINISLVKGGAKDVPKILEEAKSAVLLIPEEAANSEVSMTFQAKVWHSYHTALQRITAVRIQLTP